MAANEGEYMEIRMRGDWSELDQEMARREAAAHSMRVDPRLAGGINDMARVGGGVSTFGNERAIGNQPYAPMQGQYNTALQQLGTYDALAAMGIGNQPYGGIMLRGNQGRGEERADRIAQMMSNVFDSFERLASQWQTVSTHSPISRLQIGPQAYDGMNVRMSNNIAGVHTWFGGSWGRGTGTIGLGESVSSEYGPSLAQAELRNRYINQDPEFVPRHEFGHHMQRTGIFQNLGVTQYLQNLSSQYGANWMQQIGGRHHDRSFNEFEADVFAKATAPRHLMREHMFSPDRYQASLPPYMQQAMDQMLGFQESPIVINSASRTPPRRDPITGRFLPRESSAGADVSGASGDTARANAALAEFASALRSATAAAMGYAARQLPGPGQGTVGTPINGAGGPPPGIGPGGRRGWGGPPAVYRGLGSYMGGGGSGGGGGDDVFDADWEPSGPQGGWGPGRMNPVNINAGGPPLLPPPPGGGGRGGYPGGGPGAMGGFWPFGPGGGGGPINWNRRIMATGMMFQTMFGAWEVSKALRAVQEGEYAAQTAEGGVAALVARQQAVNQVSSGIFGSIGAEAYNILGTPMGLYTPTVLARDTAFAQATERTNQYSGQALLATARYNRNATALGQGRYAQTVAQEQNRIATENFDIGQQRAAIASQLMEIQNNPGGEAKWWAKPLEMLAGGPMLGGGFIVDMVGGRGYSREQERQQSALNLQLASLKQQQQASAAYSAEVIRIAGIQDRLERQNLSSESTFYGDMLRPGGIATSAMDMFGRAGRESSLQRGLTANFNRLVRDNRNTEAAMLQSGNTQYAETVARNAAQEALEFQNMQQQMAEFKVTEDIRDRSFTRNTDMLIARASLIGGPGGYAAQRSSLETEWDDRIDAEPEEWKKRRLRSAKQSALAEFDVNEYREIFLSNYNSRMAVQASRESADNRPLTAEMTRLTAAIQAAVIRERDPRKQQDIIDAGRAQIDELKAQQQRFLDRTAIQVEYAGEAARFNINRDPYGGQDAQLRFQQAMRRQGLNKDQLDDLARRGINLSQIEKDEQAALDQQQADFQFRDRRNLNTRLRISGILAESDISKRAGAADQAEAISTAAEAMDRAIARRQANALDTDSVRKELEIGINNLESLRLRRQDYFQWEQQGQSNDQFYNPFLSRRETENAGDIFKTFDEEIKKIKDAVAEGIKDGFAGLIKD